MSLTIDGGILAGGLSTRMRGEDKGLQAYKGQQMAQSIAETLRPFVVQVIVNCNRNESSYRQFADVLCSDVIDGFQGPLAGVHSILSASTADYVLISPCDTPNITGIYCRRMLDALSKWRQDKPNIPALFAVDTVEKSHPLHMLVHSSFKDSLENSLRKGHLKVMRWMAENDVQWLKFSDEEGSFANLNSPQDLLS